MIATARIARQAARLGYADTVAAFTWQTWLFGWMIRSAAQVLFFASMGILVGGDDFLHFAFVGNVAAMAALAALATGPDTAWERGLGTLPLLVAAPRSLLPVFAGRSSFHMVQGVAEASLIFVVISPFIGYRGNWWWMPVGLAAVAFGAYGLGLFLAAVSIRRPRAANIVFNTVFYTLVAIAGVNIATAEFPAAVQRVAAVLPLHHGLLGLRLLLGDGATAEAWQRLSLEIGVGAGWIVAAMGGFWLFADGGRRDGSLDYEE